MCARLHTQTAFGPKPQRHSNHPLRVYISPSSGLIQIGYFCSPFKPMVFCPEFITINICGMVSPLNQKSTISKVKFITFFRYTQYLCIITLTSKSCSYFLVLSPFSAFWVHLLNLSSNLQIVYSGCKLKNSFFLLSIYVNQLRISKKWMKNNN